MNNLEPASPQSSAAQKPQVALFATCLVNTFHTKVGFAAAALLDAIGYSVEVPTQQTCCGQPNYNNGDHNGAITVAKHTIETLTSYDHVIVPSSSCAGMIKNHYPRLLDAEHDWRRKAEGLANKTWELVDFVYQKKRHALPSNADFRKTITHHDSCSSIRETKVTDQVRSLIAECLPNAHFKELSESEACCGFGGTFCVKFGDIASQLATNKITDIGNTKADYCTSLDSGCNAHLNRFAESYETVRLQHLAVFLAEQLNLATFESAKD
ncbi:MAG: (Fe-S)-binding protein [Pseudomonadales bacterium]|nr:(Fe-S)-binding protein [Pseudomonadales bacterium]